MPAVIATYHVPEDRIGVRFNTYCEQYVSLITSKKGIRKAIKRGELLLNGNLADGGTFLKSGDRIDYVMTEKHVPKPYRMKLEVIHEDEDIAVVLKPAGINVSGNQFRTIYNALPLNLSPSTKKDRLVSPQPTHRLDNPTSGLLLIAKTKSARVKIGHAFEEHTIQKTYHAVVIGELRGEGRIITKIQDRYAETSFNVLKTVPSLKNKFLTLVKLKPVTGRTHQLRIHCSWYLSAPILGDKIYGKDGLILKHKGLFLSATGLAFDHPITGEKCNFKIPVPTKFETRLESEQRRFLDKSSGDASIPK